MIGLQELRVGRTLVVAKKGSGRRLDKVMKSHKAFSNFEVLETVSCQKNGIVTIKSIAFEQ